MFDRHAADLPAAADLSAAAHRLDGDLGCTDLGRVDPQAAVLNVRIFCQAERVAGVVVDVDEILGILAFAFRATQVGQVDGGRAELGGDVHPLVLADLRGEAGDTFDLHAEQPGIDGAAAHHLAVIVQFKGL